MSRDNRILLFLISLISWPGITSSGAPGPQTPKKADKQIDLRISLKTNVIKVGSPLDVHVEIWNVGREHSSSKRTFTNCVFTHLFLFPLNWVLPLSLVRGTLAQPTAWMIQKRALQLDWCSDGLRCQLDISTEPLFTWTLILFHNSKRQAAGACAEHSSPKAICRRHSA